jgi:hypothetical protein
MVTFLLPIEAKFCFSAKFCLLAIFCPTSLTVDAAQQGPATPTVNRELWSVGRGKVLLFGKVLPFGNLLPCHDC